jgi:type IV pilus assembly protein PilE
MKKNGFTLIELMIVVMVISVISAIAYPSYTSYTQKKDLAVAKQTTLQLASELEKFKNKNFSYKGFSAAYLYNGFNGTAGLMYLPVGSNATNALFRLSIKDLNTNLPLTSNNTVVTGQNWVIIVERMPLTGTQKQPKNYDLLLTSNGVKCMTRTANIVQKLTDCGVDHENW